jgi:hypothetical protein
MIPELQRAFSFDTFRWDRQNNVSGLKANEDFELIVAARKYLSQQKEVSVEISLIIILTDPETTHNAGLHKSRTNPARYG